LYKEIDNYCHQDPRIVSQDFDIFVAAFKHVNMERQAWDLYVVEIPMREREKRYRVGGGVGLGEKCSLSEVADIKSSLVLENVQAVVKLVFEN
jgi:hypothetical protein